MPSSKRVTFSDTNTIYEPSNIKSTDEFVDIKSTDEFVDIKSTYKFVENTYKRLVERQQMSEQGNDAVLKIKNAFIAYLDEINNQEKPNQTKRFPLIEYGEKKGQKIVLDLDPRITVYYILMYTISMNQATLPARYKKYVLDFNTLGWPVAHDNPFFASWLTFAQTAVAAFKIAQPDSDLSAWASPIPDAQLFTETPPILNGQSAQKNDEGSTSIPDARLFTETPLILNGQSAQNNDEGSTSSLSSDSSTKVEKSLDDYNFDQWVDAPKTLTRLIMSLNAMHRYGFTLKSEAPEKSKAAMSLAIDLFEDLKKHYGLNSKDHDDTRFKENFLSKLHSPEHDQLMSTHRKYWQVIVANVFIAFTGIGLVAIGASLLFRGHTFFGMTKSQELLHDVEQQSRNSLTVRSR